VGTNPVRVCELVVGLPDVAVLGVDDDGDGPLRIHVEACLGRPTYPCCRGVVRWKDRNRVVLMDLPTAGTVGAAGVAQTTVGMPRRGVSGRVVHRPGTPGRSGPRRHVRGWPVGRPPRLWVAYRQRRGGRLRHRPHRRPRPGRSGRDPGGR